MLKHHLYIVYLTNLIWHAVVNIQFEDHKPVKRSCSDFVNTMLLSFVAMETATPVKSVRACLTCNRSSQGHLKNLRNVAMRSILLKKQFECLGCNIEDLVKVGHKNLLVCDTCLKILDNSIRNKVEFTKEHERTKEE